GQDRRYQVTVPGGQTLRVTLQSGSSAAGNELFARALQAPSSTVYDAASQAGLGADETAVIPSTQPGVYYILVRGFSEPGDNTPVTVLAQLVPLAITDVKTDVGGVDGYVTTTITGARFDPHAIVKLARPGFAEYEPVNY